MNKKQNKETGKLGEDVACKYLVKNGFRILKRNYSKKFGEIDIIGQKDREIYFFEVKANILNPNFRIPSRPEERVDRRKLHQIGKVVQCFLQERNLNETDWYFQVIAIVLNTKTRLARVRVIDDVVPE